jgi:hypothetical protein
MADPLTLAIIAGTAAAAGGVAQGIGTAQAGKAMRLTEDEQRELDELLERRRRGELGLTERERGVMEQRFLAEQAGAQRELEAQALQQAAARGLAGGVSGREVFLAEQAEAQAERQIRQQQNVLMQQADEAERAREQARIDSQIAQQKAAEAQRRAGIAQAVSLGLAGGAEAAQASATILQQRQMQEAEAEARGQQLDALIRLQGGAGGAPGFGMGA